MTKPPAKLSSESKKNWRKIYKKFELKESDFPLLELALLSWDEWKSLKVKVEKEGYILTGKSGSKRIHPGVKAMNDSKTCFIRAWRALGFETGESRGPGRPPESRSHTFKEDEE